jgi:hypothetical protein
VFAQWHAAIAFRCCLFENSRSYSITRLVQRSRRVTTSLDAHWPVVPTGA